MKRFYHFIALFLGMSILSVFILSGYNFFFRSDENAQGDRISLGYHGQTMMLQGDEYYDNERMEFLKKDFEVSVHFSVGSSQKGKNPVYRMEIAPRSGEPVFEDKIEFNGTGLFIPLPVEQWKDGTYIIRLFRDNRLTAKRTFRLVSHMPWWQKYFPWTEKLFQ